MSYTNSSNSTQIVDVTEFLFDANEYSLPIESLAPIVNNNMEVIIANDLYQFTRVGMFTVNLDNLGVFSTFIDDNTNNIYYNPSYTSVPNEVPLGNNSYQVLPGVIRYDQVTNDIFQQTIQYLDDGGGFINNNSGGTGGGASSNQTQTPIYDFYVNSTVDDGFNKEQAIVFDDGAKRRFVFCTQNINLDFGPLGGIHKINIKAKVQREKKFLWMTYWGPSFADEIIIGCDNMALETDYVFPHPQQFSMVYRPTLDGLANFTIGNHIVNTLNIRVNLSALGYSLTPQKVAQLIDNGYNSLVNGIYKNGFKQIEKDILNTIDPSYLSTFANYTTKVNQLKDANTLKWTMGYTEKAQGYSNANDWWFDQNLGASYTENGGTGGYPLQYHYNYTMKTGSFFGRARFGNLWSGIRIIRI